jgi:hypothetical protein
MTHDQLLQHLIKRIEQAHKTVQGALHYLEEYDRLHQTQLHAQLQAYLRSKTHHTTPNTNPATTKRRRRTST